MNGKGVVMMQKFIEANNLVNSDSPAIFVEVHKLLDKKLKRIDKIKAIYEEDGDDAPMTKCPHCGSPSLIIRNCEFCGYAMLEGTSSDEVTLDTKEDVKTEKVEVEKPEEVKDVEEEVKVEKDKEPKKAKRTVNKKENVDRKPVKKVEKPKKEVKKPELKLADVMKLRRVGIKKLIRNNNLKVKLDTDTCDIKELREEVVGLLFGKKTKPDSKKASDKKVENTRGPSRDELDNMDSEELINVIKEFTLLLDKEVDILSNNPSDDDFFDCVDAIVEALSKPPKIARTRKQAQEAKEAERARFPNRIRLEDIPTSSSFDSISEKQLVELIEKFGFGMEEDIVDLKSSSLNDEDFFKIVDAVEDKIIEVANRIRKGEELEYHVKATEEKAEVPNSKSSIKVVEGIETDDNFEDIDLDTEVEDYDVTIEDVNLDY